MTREAMDWWTVEINGAAERGCEYSAGYTHWIGRFSEPASRLLARAVGGSVRQLPDDCKDGRCWQVVCGPGLEAQQEAEALQLNDD